MGAGASAGAGGPGGVGLQTSGGMGSGAAAACPEYNVVGRKNAPGGKLTLRLEPEALTLQPAGDTKIFYPYFIILAWGHSRTTFQFRLFQEGSKMITVVLETTDGHIIEKKILDVVHHLMEEMKGAATKEQFKSFFELLKEGDSDDGGMLVHLQQFCELHRLTINQVLDLLRLFSEPFEKLEAACTLHGCLLTKESVQMLVHEFDLYDDRLNICHRLKLDPDLAANDTVKLEKQSKSPPPPPPPPFPPPSPAGSAGDEKDVGIDGDNGVDEDNGDGRDSGDNTGETGREEGN